MSLLRLLTAWKYLLWIPVIFSGQTVARRNEQAVDNIAGAITAYNSLANRAINQYQQALMFNVESNYFNDETVPSLQDVIFKKITAAIEKEGFGLSLHNNEAIFKSFSAEYQAFTFHNYYLHQLAWQALLKEHHQTVETIPALQGVDAASSDEIEYMQQYAHRFLQLHRNKFDLLYDDYIAKNKLKLALDTQSNYRARLFDQMDRVVNWYGNILLYVEDRELLFVWVRDAHIQVNYHLFHLHYLAFQELLVEKGNYRYTQTTFIQHAWKDYWRNFFIKKKISRDEIERLLAPGEIFSSATADEIHDLKQLASVFLQRHRRQFELLFESSPHFLPLDEPKDTNVSAYIMMISTIGLVLGGVFYITGLTGFYKQYELYQAARAQRAEHQQRQKAREMEEQRKQEEKAAQKDAKEFEREQADAQRKRTEAALRMLKLHDNQLEFFTQFIAFAKDPKLSAEMLAQIFPLDKWTHIDQINENSIAHLIKGLKAEDWVIQHLVNWAQHFSNLKVQMSNLKSNRDKFMAKFAERQDVDAKILPALEKLLPVDAWQTVDVFNEQNIMQIATRLENGADTANIITALKKRSNEVKQSKDNRQAFFKEFEKQLDENKKLVPKTVLRDKLINILNNHYPLDKWEYVDLSAYGSIYKFRNNLINIKKDKDIDLIIRVLNLWSEKMAPKTSSSNGSSSSSSSNNNKENNTSSAITRPKQETNNNNNNYDRNALTESPVLPGYHTVTYVGPRNYLIAEIDDMLRKKETLSNDLFRSIIKAYVIAFHSLDCYGKNINPEDLANARHNLVHRDDIELPNTAQLLSLLTCLKSNTDALPEIENMYMPYFPQHLNQQMLIQKISNIKLQIEEITLHLPDPRPIWAKRALFDLFRQVGEWVKNTPELKKENTWLVINRNALSHNADLNSESMDALSIMAQNQFIELCDELEIITKQKTHLTQNK